MCVFQAGSGLRSVLLRVWSVGDGRMGLDAHVRIHSARAVLHSERLGFTAPQLQLEDVRVRSRSANTVCCSDEHAGNISSLHRPALSAAARLTIHHHIRTGTINTAQKTHRPSSVFSVQKHVIYLLNLDKICKIFRK